MGLITFMELALLYEWIMWLIYRDVVIDTSLRSNSCPPIMVLYATSSLELSPDHTLQIKGILCIGYAQVSEGTVKPGPVYGSVGRKS
jgi:hypothetical protein